jgi:hypothetical protein
MSESVTPKQVNERNEMKTTTLKADCYFQQEQYNPRIRATVPPAWVVEFDCALPNTNVPPVFYGHTRREAIENAIKTLQSFGLTGRLILN